MYNEFNSYEEALLPAILDSLQYIRDYNDNNGYTESMFYSVAKFQELDGFYQEYLDGNKTDAEALTIYAANKDLIQGKWDEIREGINGKFYYLVYSNGQFNSNYTTIENPVFPELEPDS